MVGTGNVASAAMDGDLIKMNGLSSVYYLKGGKRFVFPNQSTYASWYSDNNGGPDWSGIKTVAQSELESYPLGGNVTVRPGTKLIKITTNPTVYAVEPNGTLRSIVSEANAIELWGANWAKNVIDVADSFFTNYTQGTALTAGVYPAGTVVNPTNSSDLYYWDGANYRKFSNESAFLANGFNFTHVVTTSKSVVANGSPIASAEAALMNTAGGATTGTVTPGGSGLTVALASNTPVAANVPLGAVQVPFTSFNVTAANDGAVLVRSVTVTRGGLGASANFDGVYLYDGMTRLTTARTVNSTSNQATFTGLNYTVPAGMTKTLTVKADMDTTTVNNNYFTINSASDIDASGAAVSGTFPIMGNTMVGVAQSVGTITIEKSGSNPLTSPKAGETGAKVAEFKLTMGTEDGAFSALTLYQVGNIANDKLTNFTLKQAGVTLASATAMTGSNVVFNLATPFSLEKNNSKVFEVYADVNSTARSADTIRFYLDNNADLYAKGKTYGFGLAVDRDNTNGYDNVTADGTDASWSTIEAGQITISQKGPAVTDYAVQQQDVELLRFDMASQINAEVRSTGITLTAGGTDADEDTTDTGGLVTNGTSVNYTDIKIVDVATGAIVAGPQDLSGLAAGNDDAQTLTYTDIWNLEAGKTRTLKVTADVANFTPDSAETIKATLSAFGSSAIKNLDTNLFVTDVVPSGTIIGAAHNVKAGSLTSTLAATPSLQTYINGTSGVAMLGLNLAAGTGKDTKITSVMVTVTGADSCTTEANCISSAMLYDGDTLLSTKNISGTTITFSGLNTTIAKGTTKTLTVKANLLKLSSVGGSTTLSFAVAAAASDISAQDAEGNTITPTAATVTGPAHIISSGGSITGTLAADDSETESQVILAGASNVVLAKFRLTAATEALRLNKIRIVLPDSTAEEISTLALYDGATKLTSDVAVTDGSGADYADFNSFVADFIVAKDASKTLTVKASTGLTSNGASSGTSITASIDYDTNFEARGINGSDTVDSALGGANIDGRAMIFRKAKLTFTETALTSTAIANGSENEVYKFSVTADGNDATLKQLVFDVTLTENGTNNGITAGSWKLFKGSSDITSLVDIHGIAGTTVESSNTFSSGTSKLIVTWTSEDLITAGGTNPYTLRSTLSNFGTGADDDSIRVILNADTAAATAGFNKLVDLDQTVSQYTAALGDGTVTAGQHLGTAAATPTVASTNGNIIWSDYAVVAHDSTVADKTGDGGSDLVTVSTSSADWANGYLLKTMPFSGRTMNN